MKKIYFFIILFLSTIIINAQDVIVTHKGDTINGRITNIKDGYIFYSIKENDALKKSVISISEVQYYTQNSDSEKNKRKENSVNFDPARMKLGLNIGGSYSLNEVWKELIPDSIKYHNKLRVGLYFDGDFTYFFNKNHGIGIKYSFLKSSETVEKANYTNLLNYTFTGLLSDDIRITFIGAFYSIRHESNRNNIYANIGAGKISYKNDFNSILYSGYLSGSALAFNFDFGYDFRLTNSISLGAKLSYYIGKINNVKRSVSDPVYYSSDVPSLKLQNLNLSLGIRFLLR